MRGRRIALFVAGGLIAVAAAAVTAWQIVGVPQTLAAGAQTEVCGVRIGVVDAGEPVVLTWGDRQRAALTAGERARVAAWCVIQIERVEGSDDGVDGGGRVFVRWRPW